MSEVAPEIPEPPEGLKAGGADLWRSVMARWDVDRPHELRLLLEICRMADLLDVLHAQSESDAADRGWAMVELAASSGSRSPGCARRCGSRTSQAVPVRSGGAGYEASTGRAESPDRPTPGGLLSGPETGAISCHSRD